MRWTVEDTPERAAFRAELRAWLRTQLPAGWMEAVEASDDEAFEAARRSWDFLRWTGVIGTSGYAAPTWPREYGGLAGDAWTQAVVRAELRRWRLPVVGINLLGVGLAGPTIIAHGTEAQKERWLGRILSAEEIWCQLFSEPGAGSDLASVATRAVRDGDEWVVDGQKVWTSIAQLSSFGLLLARTDPDVPKHDGLTCFVVDMRAPGVEVRPLRQLTGSAEFNEVFFTGVRVPDENRLGDVGDGWRVARTTLMNERVALSGISLDAASIFGGARRDPWEVFLEDVRDRTDPRTRQALAQAYVDQEVKEIAAFRVASARLRGEQPGPEGAMAKVANAELNQRRTTLAVDLAGMAGVAWLPGNQHAERRAHAFLRARANSIEGGTSEVLRSQAAERVLGLPREPEA